MLSKSKRIPRKLFKPILKSNRRFNSEHFSIMVATNPEAGARFAVSVSKKVSKKAVVRNRIRRRVYSSLQNLIPRISNGLYLLIVKPKQEEIRKEKLKKELEDLFYKNKLIVSLS